MPNTNFKDRIIVLLFITNFVLVLALLGPRLHRYLKWKTAKPGGTSTMSNSARLETPSLMNDDRIQACYQSLLMGNPSVDEGSVVMHWILDSAGKIDDLKLIHSDLGDESFIRCLTDTVKATRFPASNERAGVLISHKFNFLRKDPGKITF